MGFPDLKSWLQARDRAGDHSEAALRGMRKRIRVVACGDPGVHIGLERSSGMAEIRRHDAEHCVWVVIEANFFTEDVRVGAKLAPPESVAEYHSINETGDGVLIGVNATDARLDSQQREVIRAGGESFDALRAISAGQIGADGPDHGNLVEDAGTLLEIPKLGNGHADVRNVGAAEIVEDADELFLMREGQRAEQNGVDDAEGGDVGADTEG